MHSIHLPDISTKDETAQVGTYVIEPLPRGFGVTIGNSLRRVLLSSLPGGAVTAFSINDASHEFTTIAGVKEDVVGITLNFKRLRFQVFSDEPQTLTLKKKGKGVVTAGDITTTAAVDVVNPDQIIATLDDAKTTLEMTLRVEKGRGYLAVDEHDFQVPVGMIAIDSLFSPIARTRYKVENTRVGQVTDLDKLSIEIVTDGSITPRDALEQSAQILLQQFAVIGGGLPQPAASEAATDPVDDLTISIEDLGLGSRTANALEKNEITSVKQLLSMSEHDLKNLKGFGEKAQAEVIAKLTELELR